MSLTTLCLVLRSSMCFRVPHLCPKIPKIYHWSMDSGVHCVCFPRWIRHQDCSLFPTQKLVWKMKYFIHMQYFNTLSCWLVLLSSLYIEFALVCCRNHDNVHCFGTIFPEICFCINLRRPSGPHAIRRIEKLLNCQTTRWYRSVDPDGEQPTTALWFWAREMISIRARTNEVKIMLILSYSVMNGFIMGLLPDT